MSNNLTLFNFDNSSKSSIPLYLMPVSAGIPIPVDNYLENHIDLNEFLVERPSSTFFAKVKGDDLREAGICDSDILIVDKSLTPSDGNFVLAKINQDLVVRYYRNINGIEYLESQTQQFFPLKISDEYSYTVLGTITKIIHSF